MNLKLLLYTICVTLINPLVVGAQKQLIEGVIVYTISSRASETEQSKTTGTFTISFKDGMIRKDIRMNNGYSNSIIINSRNSSVHSLRTLGSDRFAVQMDYTEYLQRQERYKGFSLGSNPADEKFAGYTAKNATLTYKDGTATTIMYTPDFQLEEARLFERFPGITHLPLAFDFQKEEGPALHLSLEKVEAKPVETSLFTIPAEYKIISSKELKELNK